MEQLDPWSTLFTVETAKLKQQQGLHRLEKYLKLDGFLEKSLKIKSALKSTEKTIKNLEESLNSTSFCRTESEISIKLLCLYLVQLMLHQI